MDFLSHSTTVGSRHTDSSWNMCTYTTYVYTSQPTHRPECDLSSFPFLTIHTTDRPVARVVHPASRAAAHRRTIRDAEAMWRSGEVVVHVAATCFQSLRGYRSFRDWGRVQQAAALANAPA